ncbi:MAG: hypothetical protein ACEQSR_07020 [Candidatus Methylacidiphilales bacterium]
MQLLLKVIYRIALFMLIFWLGAAVLSSFIPLEFASQNFEHAYYSIRFYGVPIAIVFTLTGTIKKKESWVEIISKIVLTIFACFGSLVIMTMILFGGMCAWTTDKVLFELKNQPTIKIEERSYGCGATDSGPSKLGIFKVRNFTPYFVYATPIDTNEIDKSEWLRIKQIDN